MTNEQKLKKVIEKATKGGWQDGKEFNDFLEEDYGWIIVNPYIKNAYYSIIFSYYFAKAFWKYKLPENCYLCRRTGGYHYTKNDGCGFTHREWQVCPECKGKSVIYKDEWKSHQHKMLDYVQEGKEPLKYLEKFLDKEVK